MADPLKQWANAKLGRSNGNGNGNKPMPPKMAQPAAPPPGPAPVPDIRVEQLTWLTPEQQAELADKGADPPPSWIDPMQWETAKVKIGESWTTLQNPRAVAAFIVHQTEQAAKAATLGAMAPGEAPGSPGASSGGPRPPGPPGPLGPPGGTPGAPRFGR